MNKLLSFCLLIGLFLVNLFFLTSCDSQIENRPESLGEPGENAYTKVNLAQMMGQDSAAPDFALWGRGFYSCGGTIQRDSVEANPVSSRITNIYSRKGETNSQQAFVLAAKDGEFYQYDLVMGGNLIVDEQRYHFFPQYVAVPEGASFPDEALKIQAEPCAEIDGQPFYRRLAKEQGLCYIDVLSRLPDETQEGKQYFLLAVIDGLASAQDDWGTSERDAASHDTAMGESARPVYGWASY